MTESLDLRRFPVLLVDDQPSSRRVMQLALSPRFDLHLAANGEEALALVERLPISVLVTDQRMPGMSGLELAQRVRQLLPHSERIVVTGFGDSPELMAAVSSGLVSEVLVKPVRADMLADVLERRLEDISRRAVAGPTPMS